MDQLRPCHGSKESQERGREQRKKKKKKEGKERGKNRGCKRDITTLTADRDGVKREGGGSGDVGLEMWC